MITPMPVAKTYRKTNTKAGEKQTSDHFVAINPNPQRRPAKTSS
jgi:hypothetical protein